MLKSGMRFYYKATFLLTICAVFILSVIPNPESLTGDINDKINHAFAFFVMILLAMKGFEKPTWIIITGLALYGVLIELVQAMIPSRDCSFRDLFADLCGLGLGLFINMLLNRIKAMTEKRKG